MKGNGKSVSDIRELSEFTEIEMNIGYDKITVNFGPEQSLEIIGDENIVPIIKTKVINGVLTITFVRSKDNYADPFTKIVNQNIHEKQYKYMKKIQETEGKHLKRSILYC